MHFREGYYDIGIVTIVT